MSAFVFSFISPWMVVGRQMLVKIMYTKKVDGVSGWLPLLFVDFALFRVPSSLPFVPT